MKKLNNRTVVFAGVLVAMNIILSRFFSIRIGDTLRISLGFTPLFLAGLWFGPVVGGICGMVSDFIGCILQGYQINPFLMMTAILAGALAGIFKNYVFQNELKWWKISLIVALHGIVGSLGFSTVGLHVFYGTPWSVLYATRSVQTVGLVIANSLLVSLLYQSPVTQLMKQICYEKNTSR